MSGVRRGAQGTSTGGIETSPEWKERRTRQLRRQEERWAAKAGPVEVRHVGDGAPEPGPGFGSVAGTS
jgi:hypothetical protein